MFPQTSETFIANEILALERLGVSIRLYSYRRPSAPVPHRYIDAIQAPVTYLPDPLNRHLGVLLRSAREERKRDPERFGEALRYVLQHTVRERNLDTWRRLLQASYIAGQLAGTDVQHLHAHFAHGATRVAMLTSRLTGLPYSFTAHARDVFNKAVDQRLLDEKATRARFVVTVSEYNRGYLAERVPAFANGKVRVLHNGVDLEVFAPNPATARAEDMLLYVGRFVEKKGVRHLIDAVNILRARGRTVRCVLVGDGDLRQQLETQVQEAGLGQTVSFAGQRSQEELLEIYRQATLLVMPAVMANDGDRDALPTVLLEAMACGLPVVASRLSGIPEIVDDGENGLLVETGDAASIASAVERLLDDGALRGRLGQTAREKVERCFDVNGSAKNLARLFVDSVSMGTRI
jgi:glycosyltransferase involved in cell wall biosynthesis